MPIYEFFCEDCNTVFNFFSSRPDTEKRPACPRCGKPQLRKMMSLFATLGKTDEGEENDPLRGIDESKMEKAMSGMLQAAEHVDENDPRQMAAMMRHFADKSGLPLNEPMAEALARMESGEDPEQIEADMGDSIDLDDPFAFEGTKKKGRVKGGMPERDDYLYEL